MARSGVQYEDVQRAIHTLLSRGDAPSVQRIREVLGTGSFTTLSEHLRQWPGTSLCCATSLICSVHRLSVTSRSL